MEITGLERNVRLIRIGWEPTGKSGLLTELNDRILFGVDWNFPLSSHRFRREIHGNRPEEAGKETFSFRFPPDPEAESFDVEYLYIFLLFYFYRFY